MKNILVLGGAGYIGSVVVEQLKDHNVVVLDNLSTGHRDAVDCKFVKGDISDLGLLVRVMKENKIDAVMHFCAHSIVPESYENPGKYFENNVSFGLNILEAMRKTGVKKIIFSSTAAVYGNPKRVPIVEDDEKIPTNPYGESKLMFENIIKWYYKIYGIKYVIFRYFNACGASTKRGERHDPETHLIPIILDVAKGKREKLMIFGNDYNTSDGTCVRDYIHVLDIAKAHILGLDYDENEEFNLGSGNGFSVKQIVDEVENVLNVSITKEISQRRKGDPDVLIASYDKVKKKMGWEPSLGLKEIIRSANSFKP